MRYKTNDRKLIETYLSLVLTHVIRTISFYFHITSILESNLDRLHCRHMYLLAGGKSYSSLTLSTFFSAQDLT